MSKIAKKKHGRKRRAFKLQSGQCGICDAAMVLPGFNNKDRKRNRLAAVANLATWDHLKPASRGGSSCLDNLHLVCYACNQERGASKANPTWRSVNTRLEHT